MTDSLITATSALLTPAELDHQGLERILATLAGPDVDLADIYFQATHSESWSLEDGIVRNASHAIDQGVGVRVISGEKTGFAYSDELKLPALKNAVGAARAIAHAGQSRAVAVRDAIAPAAHYAPVDPVDSMTAKAKVDLLHRLDSRARAADSRIRQVMVGLSARHDVMLVAGIDGTLSADVRPLIRLQVTVIAEHEGRRETGSHGGGGRVNLNWLLADGRAEAMADEAVRQALVNLQARPAPAGTMTVVLGPGWPGILLHEAIGHGLEGDFNRKGTSAFADAMGQQIASEVCTVVDDGTLADRRGSLNVDDEGTLTRCTTLIENGRLVGYLQDRHNAGLMKVAPTGNGRRESYAHRPMPRMTNTYMRAGHHSPDEILRSVKRGIYAVNFGGGQVDITNGKFVFSTSEAYLIEDGKVTAPVKGATLIGSGPEVLKRVSMVGNDLALDSGVGTCGKDGQQVPVGVGQPTLRVDGLTVGGVQG
ncbi:MAG: metalloprotease TldD [Gammaproteobacteria bacterium]|nr:metalloprotease TldD [Gammaproteobacteria bacterium]